jgi:MinD-like ATPase involved in chromosome partitioning or flagellar assembly
MDVVIAAGGAVWESAALREIETSAVLRLVRRCVDVADLLAVAHTGLAGAAVVAVDLPGLDADAVRLLESGGVRVAAVDADPGTCEALGIARAVHLGDLEAVARDAPTSLGRHEDRAPLVAVWGPAGAPGRSTVALSLASATAARGVDTVLVDADTQGGSLGQALSVLDDVSGIVAACRAANNGRAHEAVDHLSPIGPALRLLTGLPRADMWTQVRTGALDLVLGRLRAQAGLLVVDCGSSLEPGHGPSASARNQTTLQVLDTADHVVVVGLPDPVGLARLVRGLHDLSSLLPGCTPTVVVNRMRGTLGWSEREVRATLQRLTGVEPVAYLPHDQTGLDLAIVSGRSPREAAPSSPFVARMEVVAGHVLSSVSPAAVLGPQPP